MSKKLYKIIEIIGLLIIVYFVFKLFPYLEGIFSIVFKILLPFIIGFGIAFLFESVILWFEKKKIKRKISIWIIVILIGFVIFLIVRFAIPGLIKQISSLIDMIPSYLDSLEEIIDKIDDKFDGFPISFDIDYDKIGEYISSKFEVFLNGFGNFLQRSFSSIINILITPIIAIYFMIDYEKVEKFIKEFLINHNKKEVYIALIDIKRVLRQYFKGVIIVMVILSFVSSLCFMMMGLEYSFIFGLIIGITDIIPYIGPYIGGGIVIIFTFVSNPQMVLTVLIIIIVLQIIESNYLVPKIQSKTLNTHPIMVLVSVAIFGELFGVLGMIIAVPIVKIIEIISKSIYCYKKS